MEAGGMAIATSTAKVLTPDAGRIAALDILRGFALIGMLYANIPALAHVMMIVPGSTDDRFFQLENYAFEQRFFPIFAFLFGVGFHIFLRNARRTGFRRAGS